MVIITNHNSSVLDGIDWEAVEAYNRANQAPQVNPYANSCLGSESFQQNGADNRINVAVGVTDFFGAISDGHRQGNYASFNETSFLANLIGQRAQREVEGMSLHEFAKFLIINAFR